MKRERAEDRLRTWFIPARVICLESSDSLEPTATESDDHLR